MTYYYLLCWAFLNCEPLFALSPFITFQTKQIFFVLHLWKKEIDAVIVTLVWQKIRAPYFCVAVKIAAVDLHYIITFFFACISKLQP